MTETTWALTLIVRLTNPFSSQGAQVISTAEVRQTPAAVRRQRIGDRRRVRVPGRLTWRDGSGTLRFVSVMTRDVSDVDAFVECEMPASIPL